MTPAPISVERLPAKWRGEKDGSLTPWASNYNGALEACAKDLERALPALLHQLAERDAEVARIQNAWCVQATELRERAETAERAREELAHVAPLLLDLATSGECDTLSHDEVSDLRKLAAFLAASGGGRED